MSDFLYYCAKCNSLVTDVNEDDDVTCDDCWGRMQPLHITEDEWNGMPESTRISLLERYRTPQPQMKKLSSSSGKKVNNSKGSQRAKKASNNDQLYYSENNKDYYDRISGLSITAFVFSFLVSIVGLILGIIDLAKSDGRKKGLSIAAVSIGSVAFVCSLIFSIFALNKGIINKSSDEVTYQETENGIGENSSNGYEKAIGAIVDRNTFISLVMLKMSNAYKIALENGETDEYFLYPDFTNEQYLRTFDEYKKSSEEHPGSISDATFQAMTKYFNINSQEDLDNWIKITKQIPAYKTELPELAKTMTTHKNEIDGDCFDAGTRYYEATKAMSEIAFPYSESEMISYLSAINAYMEESKKQRERMEMYIEIPSDFEAYLNEIGISLGEY